MQRQHLISLPVRPPASLHPSVSASVSVRVCLFLHLLLRRADMCFAIVRLSAIDDNSLKRFLLMNHFERRSCDVFDAAFQRIPSDSQPFFLKSLARRSRSSKHVLAAWAVKASTQYKKEKEVRRSEGVSAAQVSRQVGDA